MRLCAFADEASPDIEGQVRALSRNGIGLLEIRGVNGKNIKDVSVSEAFEIRKHLDSAGIDVWSIGSPVGKIALDGDMDTHFEEFRHITELSDVLGARRIRMFSFYPAENMSEKEQRTLVFENIEKLLSLTPPHIMLCHENEKDIYGETAERCLELYKAFPRLRAVFDPANFVQVGEDVLLAWERLAPFTEYIHIKDADSRGINVPAGAGEGKLPEIIRAYLARGGEVMTLEPHLYKFTGLSALENGNEARMGKLNFKNNDESFDAAAAALRNIIGHI